MQLRAANVGMRTTPVGTVDAALEHALSLLAGRPDVALEQATEILNVIPAHPVARLVVGSAQRLLGNTAAAVAMLEELARSQPGAAPVRYELGLALAAAGRGD